MAFSTIWKTALFGAAIAAVLPAAAQATVLETSYDFSGTFASSSPYTSPSGSFTLDYDTATKVYSIKALSLAFGSVTFDASTAKIKATTTTFYISNTSLGTLSALGGNNKNSYSLAFALPTGSTLGTFNDFAYLLPGKTTGIQHALRRSATAQVAAVPEPASWALMLGGFGMIGGALRSSRKRTAVSFG